MHPISPASRSASLARCLGKLVLFLAQGNSPRVAWWLARRDAVKRNDYRRVAPAALEAAWRADPSWADITVGEGKVSSRQLGLEFLNDDLAGRGYTTFRALAQLGWTFEREGANLAARRGTVSLLIVTDEEREMMREIFLEGCYNLNAPGDWHVVDIGGNVGMAALFFSEQPWVKCIHSYEPFAATAEGFELNMHRNPELARKIKLHQVALGEQSCSLAVEYQSQLRGSMSLEGVGAWRAAPLEEAQTVEVRLEPASQALAPILAKLEGCRLLGKIDCEGSEYAILRDLDSSGALARFDALIIEWHGRGPDELSRILNRWGFALHIRPLSERASDLGLIYAVKLFKSS